MEQKIRGFADILNRWLFSTKEAPSIYIVRGILITFTLQAIPAALIVFFTADSDLSVNGLRLNDILGYVLFAPFVETFLMFPVIKVLRRLIASDLWIAFCSAVIWAGLHVWASELSKWFVFFGFFVLSAAIITWSKQAPRLAFKIAFTIHAVNNGLAVLITFI